MVRWPATRTTMEGVNGAFFGDKRAQLNTPSWWAEAHKGANSAHRYFQGSLLLRRINGNSCRTKLVRGIGSKNSSHPLCLIQSYFPIQGKTKNRRGSVLPVESASAAFPHRRSKGMDGNVERHRVQPKRISGMSLSISRRSRP